MDFSGHMVRSSQFNKTFNCVQIVKFSICSFFLIFAMVGVTEHPNPFYKLFPLSSSLLSILLIFEI